MQSIPARQMLEAYRRDLLNMTGYHAPIDEEFFLQVDSLGLEEIARGTGIASASWVGAHFFAGYENQEPLSCEMTVPELDGMAELRSLTRGTRAQEAIAQIRAAQALPEVQESDYELRLLVIPGLLLEAFRLRSLGGNPDLVLPLMTLYSELKAKPVFKADEFLAILRPKAARRSQFNESYMVGV